MGASASTGSASSGRDLLAEYVAYRDRDDMENAVAVYGEMADWVFERAVQQRGWDPAKRSLVSSFMPKSGGTYTFNRLKSCGYIEYYWAITHRLHGRSVHAVPRALELYLRGGMASHTHFLPSVHNLTVLDAAGVDRVWVHLRDPRETVASSYYHSLGIGQGSGVVGEERARLARAEAELNGLDVELGSIEKINRYFLTTIEVMVDWAGQWLDLDLERPGYVTFSTFRELQDPKAMLQRVFTEFGMTAMVPHLPPSLPEDRRRTEHAGEWRDYLTADTVDRVNATVDRTLGKFERASTFVNGL